MQSSVVTIHCWVILPIKYMTHNMLLWAEIGTSTRVMDPNKISVELFKAVVVQGHDHFPHIIWGFPMAGRHNSKTTGRIFPKLYGIF